MLARLCYFSNGVTRVLRRRDGGQMPFRAAACTGALYHVELYAICGGLADLAPGVYHYGAHDNALRLLRAGDFRAALVSATGGEPSVADAAVVLAFTSTFWRNSWKYQARAYRHSFWDTGTILANLFAIATANNVPASLVQAFADREVNRLLDVDPTYEATICLVALGQGAPSPPPSPPLDELRLPTQRLSDHQVEYPAIVAAHTASSLGSGAEATAWRASAARAPAAPTDAALGAESIEAVILRRGSSRRFSREPIMESQLAQMLELATAPVPSDLRVFGPLTQPYLIVNAVSGMTSGTYHFDRQSRQLELLRPGDFRRQAAFLDLGQALAGEAAVNVYWLSDLDAVVSKLRDRGYRAAQLEAAIEGGKLYLAAYALSLGATGLTFFDDDVTRFFSPHAQGKSVMFLTAVGHPARPPA
jgi:SagB-type dehydrogenase family enzyme